MTENVEVLIQWVRVCLVIAGISTTAFPILYSFSGWRKLLLGRMMMAQAIAFAAAVDLTLLFTFWVPSNVLVIFWANAIIFTGIAVSTASLSVIMWRLNHPKKEKK